MNRRRLKGEDGPEDTLKAIQTLFGVVITMVRVMAPFTPFLTEMMYQQLRKKVPQLQKKESASVHYLMLPVGKQELIDEDIERAVGRMQAVIDLGRVLRDRKTMPLKYPLPEVVVINKDQQCLDDIKSLEKYIKEELNVRSVTLSGDKASYGVTLRAEPDHKTLGLRLKGAFKPVMAEIKTLSDSVLTSFLDGEKLVVQGHKLTKEDLRIMYSFSGEKSKELADKYEADSFEDILVMLDTSPDQSMLDEGVAREVINRIQKLRKSSGLKVSDKVTMFFTISPANHNLSKIVSEYLDYIQSSSKTPLRPLPSSPPSSYLNKEEYELKGAKLTLTVSKGFPADYSGGVNGSLDGDMVPAVPWCNVHLLNCQPASYISSSQGGILLPQDLNLSSLISLVQQLFGVYGLKLELYLDPSRKTKLDSVSNLDGKTIYVFRSTDAVKVEGVQDTEGFNCKFVNVMVGGVANSLLLENPVGYEVENMEEALACLGKGKSTLYADQDKKKVVKISDLKSHAGQTLYL